LPLFQTIRPVHSSVIVQCGSIWTVPELPGSALCPNPSYTEVDLFVTPEPVQTPGFELEAFIVPQQIERRSTGKLAATEPASSWPHRTYGRFDPGLCAGP
jgi:hypothetical protein